MNKIQIYFTYPVVLVTTLAILGVLSSLHHHTPPLVPGQVWLHGQNPFIRETNTILGVWDGYVQYEDYSNKQIRYQPAYFFVRDSTQMK